MNAAGERTSASQKARRLAGLAVLGLAMACTARAERMASTPQRESAPPYRIDPEAPTRLIVRDDLVERLESATASRSDLEARVTGVGRLRFDPDASYSVRVPFGSYVERVLVGIGDQVEEGQPLAELRSSELAQIRAELARAKVAVRVESQAIERLRPLVEDGTGTKRELAEAIAALEIAKAELASARQTLQAVGPAPGKSGDRYTLRASAPGSVIKRNVAPGERVSAEDEPAFVIGDRERIVVRASFPERDAVWVAEGAACSFTVHAIGGGRWEGTITRVSRAMDAQTRSVEAVCAPETHDPQFSSEMVARVDVHAHGTDRVVIPRSGLLMRRDEWVVFVRSGRNAVERRNVEPGLSLGKHVQIVLGLEAGEEVITQGAVLLDGELDVLL
jgi:membrane fusion protein, heavy metal efflux system